MGRLTLIALAALLLLPAFGQAGSDLRLRGVVVKKNAAAHRVTIASGRLRHVLLVPGSLTAIRINQRVELRNTTLRRHGNGSRVLARGVRIVSSRIVDRARAEEPDDDEREARGPITSLSPLTVGRLTCAVPRPALLVGFRVGDFVEITCDLVAGVWTLRKIQREDDDEVRDEQDDDRHGGHDDDGGGNSGPGGGGGGGHSGPGGG